MIIKKRRRREEEIEQSHFMQWVQNHVVSSYSRLIFAIPNGGSRYKKEIINKKGEKIVISPEGIRLKAQGVKAGVLDIFISIPSKVYHGHYIEFKSTIGKLTPEQKEFIKSIEPLNYKWSLVRNRYEAIQAFKDYLQDDLKPIILKTWQTSTLPLISS